MPISLNDFEEAIRDAAQNRMEAIDCLNEVLSEIERCRQLLSDLRKDVKSFEKDRKEVKIIGTATSVAGAAATSAAIIGNFFTGGATLFLLPFIEAAGVVGVGAGLTGAAINITTEIVNVIKTKGYNIRLDEIVSTLNAKLGSLKEFTKSLDGAVDLIQQHFNMDREKSGKLLNEFLARVSRKICSKLTTSDFMGAGGILIVTLSLVRPCAADPLILLQGIAQSTLGSVVQTQDARISAEVLNNVFKPVTMDIVKTAAKESAKATAIAATEVTSCLFTKIGDDIANQMALAGGKVFVETAADVSVIAVKSVTLGLSVAFAIVDIVSLINTLNSDHPTVELTETTLNKLDEVEEKIRKLLREVESDAQCVDTSTEESDGDESDDDETSHHYIYDISTRTISRWLSVFEIDVNIFLANGSHPPHQQLFNELRQLLESHERRHFMLSYYLHIISIMEELVNSHSWRIKFNATQPIETRHATITLGMEGGANNHIELEETTRDRMRQSFFPILPLLRKFFQKCIDDCEGVCCIYRIRCKLCKIANLEFNYVGQTVILADRIRSHQGGIWEGINFFENEDRGMPRFDEYTGQSVYDRLEPGDLPVHLRGRPFYFHIPDVHFQQHTGLFQDMYEVDICHYLDDYRDVGSNTSHSKVRRSWEIYYQWLF